MNIVERRKLNSTLNMIQTKNDTYFYKIERNLTSLKHIDSVFDYYFFL